MVQLGPPALPVPLLGGKTYVCANGHSIDALGPEPPRPGISLYGTTMGVASKTATCPFCFVEWIAGMFPMWEKGKVRDEAEAG